MHMIAYVCASVLLATCYFVGLLFACNRQTVGGEASVLELSCW